MRGGLLRILPVLELSAGSNPAAPTFEVHMSATVAPLARVVRKYRLAIRIGSGPWTNTGIVCESESQAFAVGVMLSKWWAGAADFKVTRI